MSIYMPIIAALKSGLIKPEEFVAYTPDEKRRIYMQDYNSSIVEKETELNLGWHAVIYKDFGVLLVADKATEATITQYGNISIKALEDYANLYQNKLLQSIGVALTSELIKEIPENLICKNVWYYSHTQPSLCFKRNKRRYLHNPAIQHDHRRHYGPVYRTQNMQPTLFIPPDTIVEIDDERKTGKSKENGFKIYPKNSSDISKLHEQYMEPMWVKLIDAMYAGVVLSRDFVEYLPDKASVSFSKEETNTHTVQTAETEYTLGGWRPIVLRKEDKALPYLVATHSSQFELEIHTNVDERISGYCRRTIGKNQFDIGIKLLERYAGIYNSKALNAQAIPFNQELFVALDASLLLNSGVYYLANTFRFRFNFANSKYHELRMGLKWAARTVRGFEILDEEPMSKLPIRIATQLPESIMVQINNPQYDGSTEEKALKLKLLSKEETS